MEIRPTYDRLWGYYVHMVGSYHLKPTHVFADAIQIDFNP